MWRKMYCTLPSVSLVIGCALWMGAAAGTSIAYSIESPEIRSFRLTTVARVTGTDGKLVDAKGEILFERSFRWRRTESIKDLTTGSCGDGNTAWEWSEHKGTTSFAYRIDIGDLRRKFATQRVDGEVLFASARGLPLVDPRSRLWKSFPHAHSITSATESTGKERLGETETARYTFQNRIHCWFGVDDGIIRKQVLMLNGKEIGGLLVTKVETNPKLDSGLFTYKPSAGVAITDQTEFWGKVLKPTIEGGK